VLSRAEQDLWEVQTPGGPVLLPAAKGIVVSVDLGAGRVTVDPPAGLFD
jgi:ribosomal 30S subunit maturation factor RimM